jgi:hypothetical protein
MNEEKAIEDIGSINQAFLPNLRERLSVGIAIASRPLMLSSENEETRVSVDKLV